MASDNRDFVSLECEECGNRNYRTEKRVKGQVPKLALKKYCRHCRAHRPHKERKK